MPKVKLIFTGRTDCYKIWRVGNVEQRLLESICKREPLEMSEVSRCDNCGSVPILAQYFNKRGFVGFGVRCTKCNTSGMFFSSTCVKAVYHWNKLQGE